MLGGEGACGTIDHFGERLQGREAIQDSRSSQLSWRSSAQGRYTIYGSCLLTERQLARIVIHGR